MRNMKYVLINKLVSLGAKKPMYITNKENGNWITLTDKVEEAKIFNSIEEIDVYVKQRKLKKKDFTTMELNNENKSELICL